MESVTFQGGPKDGSDVGRFLLIDESGVGSRYVVRAVGDVWVRTAPAVLMRVEGSKACWAGGAAITQLIVEVIRPPLRLVDLGPGESEVVVWAPHEGTVVEAGALVDPLRITPFIEGRMRPLGA